MSNFDDNGLGFQLIYESSNVAPQMTHRSGMCGGSFRTPNGIFTSPSYPDNYPNRADCVYTISQPKGTVILLNFLSMEIQISSNGNCYDYLEIRDGPSKSSPLLVKLCGNEIPDPIQSSQNLLWMK